jgi:hypothetical protein
MKVKLEAADRFERDFVLRLPFRFGVITVTHGTQAVLRVRIKFEDGGTSEGVASEALAAKWFEKSPQFTDAQNHDQLRQALQLAIDNYVALGFATPFGLYAGAYRRQIAKGAELGLNPLVASYGPALLDRAILDAVGKATGQSFAQMIASNLPGIAATDLTPDIEDAELQPFLAGLKHGASIDMRHTVGLVDPLTASDRPATERVDDGLPETLEEVVSYYEARYYKLKVGGNVKADLDRLTRIASVLDKSAGNYLCTFDGNEQYDDVDGIVELWRKVEETPALARMVQSTLFIEQPIKRQSALGRPVTALAKYRPVIIDESDGELSTFPEALKLGYAGVSTKNCKGFYKSILNASRVAKLGKGYFMSAEDLTTQPGVSVQQDLALVSLLGLGHVERNAHHFIDGMSGVSEREQMSFLAAHPTLYDRPPGKPVRLKVEDGRIDLASLGCPGFAVGAEVDFEALREMRAAPKERIQ